MRFIFLWAKFQPLQCSPHFGEGFLLKKKETKQSFEP
jgi:hypothetical protein